MIAMRKHLAALGACVLAALLCSAPTARAQEAQPVPACGSVAYTANGVPMRLTQTPDGRLCTSTTSGAITGTTTNASSTITTGGTFQSILASNASRKGCFIQNPITATETLFVFFGANGSATTAKSVNLSPGAAVTCAIGGSGVLTDNVSATATTTAHAFVEMDQ